MTSSPRSAARLVAGFGLLTFAITLARLWAERSGKLPATSGGPGVWLGISWLPPLVGFTFGLWLCRQGDRPEQPGRALRGYLLALSGAIAWLATWGYLLRAQPFQYTFMLTPPVWIGMAWWAGRRHWPRLARLNLGYGLWARLGVMAVTIYCLVQGWDTHYTRMGPEDRRYYTTPVLTGVATAVAQLAIWVPFTVLTGGVGGCLAAVLRRR